jgi:DNA-binding HxlR family transcriptional regulator
MGASYRQFCPVAKAMELLDERWTLLVIRELAAGSERFNELRRGLPRMSPTLLSKRLHQLVRAGLIEKVGAGADVRYLLTPAGLELRPIIESLGAWGVRWIGELGDADLDPKLLLWDMRRNVDHSATPPGRTVVQFSFRDVPSGVRNWWLVISDGEADVCDADPGHPVTVLVVSRLRTMVEIWRGDRTWAAALRAGDIEFRGAGDVTRAVPRWFTLSGFAGVARAAEPLSAAVS